jgi:hypothetical protein
MRRYGPYAFTVQILGHGYATRKDLCLAQRQFIEEHDTLWPNGYNIQKGRNDREDFDAKFVATAQALSQDPEWRAAVAAAAAERKQSSGWRVALKKRSENVIWRHNISTARPSYLHTRWHLRTSLVPSGTTVENCPLCKAVVERKERPKVDCRPHGPQQKSREQTGARNSSSHIRWHVKRGLVPQGTTVEECVLCKKPPRQHREPLKLTDLNIPNCTIEEQLDETVQRVNAMFKRA